jgi:putative lipoprotein
MKLIVASAFLLQSAAGDSWFGVDKLKHFFVSAFIQSVSYSALRAVDVNHGEALIGASCVTAALAIGKEFHDLRGGSVFSARDLVWDAAGAGGSVVLLDRTRR